LVTGANRGLGLAFVRALLAAGARKVYAGARNLGAATQNGVQPIRLDVTRPDEVASAVAECGGVNLLINNAGIALGKSFLLADGIKAARAELETNYLGPLAINSQASEVVLD
jgi:NAD(P)-dependent dehydrogenase (short-subunit alcohol dehydrogenase family)